MHVITLKGTGSTGKTSTLGLVYNMLNASPNYTLIGARIPIGKGRDFHASFKDNSSSKLIAIYSQGDNLQSISQAFHIYGHADILILATRTRGAGLQFIKNSANIPIDFIGKSTSNDPNRYAIINNLDASLIFQLI